MAGRIMISAAKSGSGKTWLSCVLLSAIKKRIERTAALKCGPDFIDPMFHRAVLKVESRNLDSYFLPGEKARDMFRDYSSRQDFVLLEGVMGLYDGLGGISETASSYEIASLTDCPIVLVVDAHGMGRSLFPLIRGFLDYDRKGLIRGVILNRISKGFFQMLKEGFEQELPELPLLGYFPNLPELSLESRHLGLKMPGEVDKLQEKLARAAEILEESVDLEKLLKISGASAAEIDASSGKGKAASGELEPSARHSVPASAAGVTADKGRAPLRLAVARDEAFCFYYPENLEILENLGVELIDFSPIRDRELPNGIHGLLLGGGYPELYLPELSENKAMLDDVREKLHGGLPSLAECGGFMYLHREILDEKGSVYQMAGLIPEQVSYQGKLVRFGYAEFKEKTSNFLPEGEGIRGHEFHYYDSTGNGADVTATKPLSGRSWDCVMEGPNQFWGFPHLYYPSNPHFIEHFVEKMREFRDREKGLEISE